MTSLEGLTPDEKRKLLAQLLEQRAAAPTSHPLSAGQSALWFLAQLDPSSAAYNAPFVVRLRSPVDAEALRRAAQQLVDRHAALRTTFAADGGKPVQLVHPKATAHVQQIDVTGADEGQLIERATQSAHQPFDLARGPLLRVELLSRAVDDHVLIVTTHHIVADLWCLLVLIDELRLAYAAQRTLGRPAELPPLALAFSDHVRQQAELLAGPAGERALGYWTRELAGELPVLNLPGDRPRPAVQTFRGAAHPVRLDRATTQRARELAQARGATLNSTVLAAFSAWLGRLAGQSDVLVGVPTLERDRAELAGVVGYFINPIVIRSDLSADPSFQALVERVHARVLDGFAHNAYPFPLLVERLEPARGRASHSPIFQAMFVLQQSQRSDGVYPLFFGKPGEVDLGGLRAEAMTLESRAAQFDVEMMLTELDGEITGHLYYNRDLFDPDTIARFVSCFQSLVGSALDAPERRVSELALLTPAERQRALVTWNDTATDHPREVCFHQLFDERVRATPSAVAVSEGALAVTYAELDARAAAVALDGVRPGVLVAILMDRSVDMLAVILAVFRAGGAYVPLDPAYPADRLAHILADSGAAILVAERRYADRLPPYAGRVVWASSDTARAPSTAPAAPAAGPRDLSYVIYTSGSTGKPKGVMVEHLGMLNHLFAKVVDLDVTAHDVVAQTASQCFDISVWQFLTALLVGGQTRIYADEITHDPSALISAIERDGITVAEIVPSMLRAMIEEIVSGRTARPTLARLRWLLVTGEMLPPDLCRAWHRLYPTVPLLNAYGPTECSDDVTHHVLREPPAPHLASTPIGRPIINTQVYVLDKRLEPVPVGVFGEIYVGGVGVGRGYLGQPERTREVFIADPFRPGGRLYKTGDLARYLPDGAIDMVGRVDHQVKVRGFRIELGEIEAALKDLQGMRAAAVVARPTAGGDKQLVGYVVMDGHANDGDLRGALRARLPEFMVPEIFVRLEAMPLTPNGKLDRAALPAPSAPAVGVGVAPTTDTERALAAIWGEVLARPTVGATDNFFEIGGHSLLATQVTSRVRATLGVELALRTFFEHPTIAGLARRIDETRPEGRLAPLGRAPRDGDLALSFAQERLWFLDRLQPNSAFYNVPGAFELEGPLDTAALRGAFEALVRRHEILRTTFPAVDGRPRQIIHPQLTPSFPIVDVASPEELARRTAEEVARPFDLAQGPLFRTLLLRSSPTRWTLIVTFHNMVSDGWTGGVLVRELSALYTALSRGQTPALPELTVQYADFAAWQRSYLEGEVEARELAYWRKQLAGAPPALDLPTDRPRPPVQSFAGRTAPVRLGRALTERLTALAQSEGGTLFMGLLAAFQALLVRTTGETDVVVGSPIAGRTRPETEPLIGVFVNTIVLRTELAGGPSFREALRKVREVTLGAYMHQTLPFERLVDALSPERDLARAPLFQVMLTLQNAHMPVAAFGDVQVRGRLLETDTSKLDLHLMLFPGEDGLSGFFEYASDLFEARTIERLAEHLVVLLEGLVAEPDRSILELPVMLPSERRELLDTWAGPAAASDAPRTLTELVAAQAARTPAAPAIDHEGRTIAYGELWARVERVASALAAEGVGPEVLVGVAMERSIDLVVAILGIMHAGGAYVPIDPTYPAERTAWIMEDARAPILVTQGSLVQRLGPVPARVLTLAALEASVSAAARRPAGPRSAAYVIYTSGSTGRPKGVVIEHHNVVAFAEWARQAFTLEQLTGVAASTSICFDLFVFEVLVPLCWGGRLVMLDNALSLASLPPGTHVGLINTVPSAMTALLDVGGVPSSVHTVNLAGEPFREDLARRIHALPHVRQVYNLYGPSETTTYSTYAAVAAQGAPTIGRPVSGTTVYLLDPLGQPVPIGVRGELFIGGAGVARGYLHRPELTDERFVHDPFRPETSARMYKTGDICRWRADGQLELVGRVDHQVKVRGFRIELGEIEAALRQHTAVREAVVQAREDVRGDKRLVAYLVLDDAEAARLPSVDGEPTREDAVAEQTSRWQVVYDAIHEHDARGVDPTRNFVGWNSIYTGAPIPSAEMEAWADATVSQLRALEPRHVLELGCGTGLLLFRLAPHVETYVGTDFSAGALEFIRQHPDRLRGVTLRHQQAHDLSGLAEGSVDLVVLNSVAQYFASLDYLLEVLRGALTALRPGGHLFLGDLRSLPLNRAFHASIELERAARTCSAAELYARVHKRVAEEKELVLDPAFFLGLRAVFPQLTRVEVRPKRGRYDNELSRFRYDVVLSTAAQPPVARVPVEDWRATPLTPSTLEAHLRGHDGLVLTHVPNARTARATQLATLLGSSERPANAAALDKEMKRRAHGVGFDPEDFLAAGQSLGLHTEISWAEGRTDGSFDVALVPRGQRPVFPVELRAPRPLRTTANDPLRSMHAIRAYAALKQALGQRLPAYMIPHAFVTLEALPLTPNGKVDRQALPAPDTARPELVHAFVPPSSALETTLATIWADVLGIEKVGIDDRFFDVGGTSLTIVRVQARLQEAIGRRVSVVDLFQYPTIRALVAHLEAAPEAERELDTSRERATSRREALEKQRERRQKTRGS